MRGFRFQDAERQILQLGADFAHAEAMRDGRVNLHGLGRNALLPFGRERPNRAHIVQAVGQLHHDDADVVHHGEQHLADALGLALFARGQIQLAQFGDAVDHAGDIVAEFLFHFGEGGGGVLHHIVEQAGFQAHQVHVHVGQLQGHHQRMHHEGLARNAPLAEVARCGELESFAESGQVFVRPQGMHPPLQLGVKWADLIRHRNLGLRGLSRGRSFALAGGGRGDIDGLGRIGHS